MLRKRSSAFEPATVEFAQTVKLAAPQRRFVSNYNLTFNHNADQSIITLLWIANFHLTLKMTSAQDVETSVIINSPSQDSFQPDDQISSNCK